ncbi:MAG: class I SAM-dependent methyltransferase [Bacteroidota bacterium]
MKKYLPEKFKDIKVPSLLKEATQKMDQLLPASVPKSAAQLPLPGTPFDHYRLKKLIQLLNLGSYVGGRTVLEVGCGVGDLLKQMSKYSPKELYAVDSSTESLDFARRYLAGIDVDLTLADPRQLPFPDKSFDVVMVMYELQHIENEKEVQQVVDEAARVCRQWIILVEETAPEKYTLGNVIRRPVDFYKSAFKKANEYHEDFQNTKDRVFYLRKFDYLHVNASQYIFTGRSNPWHWLRWLISPLLYLMGFPSSYMKLPTKSKDLPTSKLAMKLQEWALPFTNSLDAMYQANDGTTVMWFEREKLFRRG